ncbi:hypothetical protein HDU96_010332 [Phlyctochytrium bullatum]|nr:hypothetical protein HDU96_010332 [Phlyctochytrium bullatum]
MSDDGHPLSCDEAVDLAFSTITWHMKRVPPSATSASSTITTSGNPRAPRVSPAATSRTTSRWHLCGFAPHLAHRPNPAIPNLFQPDPSASPTSGTLTPAQLDTEFVGIVRQQVMDEVREFGRLVCHTPGSFWIRSQSPVFGRVVLATGHGGCATFPEGYSGPDVFVWLPRLLLQDGAAALKCPVCGCAEGCEVIGCPEPLLVRAMRPYYVVSRKYRCFRCVRLNGDTREAYFMPYEPKVLAQFPPHLAAEFSATNTTNGAFDIHVIALITGCLGSTRVGDLSHLLSVVLDMAKTPGAGG